MCVCVSICSKVLYYGTYATIYASTSTLNGRPVVYIAFNITIVVKYYSSPRNIHTLSFAPVLVTHRSLPSSRFTLLT